MLRFIANYGMVIVEVAASAMALFLLCATGLCGGWLRNFFRKPAKALWGDMSDAEIKKFGLLSAAFFLLVGSYWMLRSVKDGFFDTLVGFENQPIAKILSMVVFFLVIPLYGKLSDWFEKTRLFWGFCGFYSIMFVLIGYCYAFVSAAGTISLFSRGLGWFSYIMIESVGSIMIAALFWAFVSSITKTESAKKGYPMVFLAAQIGTFIGTDVVAKKAVVLGFSNLFYLIACIIMVIPFVIQMMVNVTPAELMLSDAGKTEKSKKKPGVWDGLRLIAANPYLMGVAVVATVYEIVGTIIDFQFKMLAKQIYAKEAFAAYMGQFSRANALVAMIFALLGTSFLLRRFGIRICLLGYPAMAGMAILSVWVYPQLGVFFCAMIAIKAFSYVLNNPVKEILYIPTSKDVKFKAKGFIDACGGRVAKGAGSAINGALRANMGTLLTVGGAISLGIVGIWIVVAVMLGKSYDKLIESKEIIS